MHAGTKRLRMPATRAIGLRKPVAPKPSPDLRVFKAMQQISLSTAREYIDRLLGPA
jgi:hypothetical protein